MTRTVRCSAPGRVCLFGEHQDYLGLTVVPCALNLRCTVSGVPRSDGEFKIRDVIHGCEWSFRSDQLSYSGEDSDYLKAVVAVMAEQGMKIGGATVEISNQVPLKSGLSSSAALLVSWAKFLDLAFGLRLEPLDLAMLCYRAEHDELGVPCGVMDQISSSFGGVVEIQCRDPPKVSRLAARLEGLVVGDTLVSKRTVDVHSIRTREMASAVRRLESLLGHSVDLEALTWDEVRPHLSDLPETERKRITATIRNRDITRRAVSLLKERNPSLQALGKLMSDHHTYLRDYYEVSHPKIERLLEAARRAGALGGKLTGAGLGGCIVVLAPGRQEAVAEAIRRAGGKPYIVRPDQGATEEKGGRHDVP